MGQKTLCELSDKAFQKNPEKIKELVRDADYICKRCFRSARTKKNLCKPEKLRDS
jgi:hypothetical protein